MVRLRKIPRGAIEKAAGSVDVQRVEHAARLASHAAAQRRWTLNGSTRAKAENPAREAAEVARRADEVIRAVLPREEERALRPQRAAVRIGRRLLPAEAPPAHRRKPDVHRHGAVRIRAGSNVGQAGGMG